jgi:hypothetical protein
VGLGIKYLSPADVTKTVLEELGLDPATCALTSHETLAGLLRRAGSFRCPCSGRVLVQTVTESLRGLTVGGDELAATTESVLDELVAYGDFIEVDSTTEQAASRTRLLYAAPPSFVVLPNGRMLLLGLAPESRDLLPSELSKGLVFRGHVRTLSPTRTTDAASLLKAAGYFEVPQKLWLQGPKTMEPKRVYDHFVSLLRETDHLTEPTSITILNPSEPVRYYKGRWTPPASASGCFVARRQQLYGAPLWCFVRLSGGRLAALLDLPIEDRGWRGCDEAWRLQAAIDACNGNPQIAEVSTTKNDGMFQLRFFSPLPHWAIRQMDVLATSIVVRGALFAYNVTAIDLPIVREFLAESLWMSIAIANDGDNGTTTWQ